MTLRYAGIGYEVREVVLRDKPASMLTYSAKGTVPVWVEGDQVLDESLDIISWALQQNDPDGWLDASSEMADESHALVSSCESDFKPNLDGYKYASNEASGLEHRTHALAYLQNLERRLEKAAQADKSERFLCGGQLSVADVCIFPFVRQFAHVDKTWFDSCQLPHLQVWLENRLNSSLFLAVMTKYPPWHPGDSLTLASVSG